MVDISIVIATFNTKDLTRACIHSIISSYPKEFREKKFEIILVDNASSDGTADEIKGEFGDINVLQNKTNVGFAAACNQGVKDAKGAYFLFLNSDTRTTKKSNLNDLIDKMRENTTIGIIGGALVSEEGLVQKSYGSFYHLLELIKVLFTGKNKGRVLSIESFVDWVSGGFMLTKKSLFQALNGFDEHFFMYLEDMEFCYRASQKGHKVLYAPWAKVFHKEHGSSSRSFAIGEIYKGILYFYRKHKNGFLLILVKGMLLLKALVAMGIGVVSGNKYLFSTYKNVLRYAL